jgi:hypothetical protein
VRSDPRPRPGRSREPRLRGRPRLSRDVRGPNRSLVASAGWSLVLASYRTSWTSHPLIRSEFIRGSPARAARRNTAPRPRTHHDDPCPPVATTPGFGDVWARERDVEPAAARACRAKQPAVRGQIGERPRRARGGPLGAGRTRSSPRWSSLRGRGCRRGSLSGLEWFADRYGVVRRPAVAGITGVVGRGRCR